MHVYTELSKCTSPSTGRALYVVEEGGSGEFSITVSAYQYQSGLVCACVEGVTACTSAACSIWCKQYNLAGL